MISILFGIILLSPFIFKLEPELLYSDRKEIVHRLEGELNLPTIYLYNSKNGGFLGDILPFFIIDDSYIAKDIDCTEENIQKILENKDISKGMLIFINEEHSEDVIDEIKKFLNYTDSDHLQRLTSCDAYYIY